MLIRFFRLKTLCTLLRCSASLSFALTITACSQVTCRGCTYDEYPLINLKSKPHFPALKYAHQPANSEFRHVYLEGDGNAWHKGRVPSNNPTSRQKLTLKLMLQDSNDSLYLDRPCYGYKAMPKPCDSAWWTNARYSEEVVAAMNEALDGLQSRLGPKPLVLIGHSGGGTLSLLLAQRRADVRAVVTLAGNLAPHRWAEHHGYLPLEGSLTPEPEQLPKRVLQWHFAGEDDRNIPSQLTQEALKDSPQASLFVLTGNHNCCWRKHWPNILERLTQSLAHGRTTDDMAHK